MVDDLEKTDLGVERPTAPVLKERDLILISGLVQSFPSSDQIATPEDIVAASLEELSRLSPEEQELVEPSMRELCQGGARMVFVGGRTRRDNLVFEMLGAHHCQRGNMTNLFHMPAEEFRAFVRRIEAQAEDASSKESIEAGTGVVRKAIGVEK